MKAPHQCEGITKSWKRWSITSKNDMKENGRLVCEPLLNGGNYSLFHIVIFNYHHVKINNAIVAYLDFETTGLDVMEHNIVEIGIVEHSSSAVFSTVVCPPKFETNTVHGISDDELREGSFPEQSCEHGSSRRV